MRYPSPYGISIEKSGVNTLWCLASANSGFAVGKYINYEITTEICDTLSNTIAQYSTRFPSEKFQMDYKCKILQASWLNEWLFQLLGQVVNARLIIIAKNSTSLLIRKQYYALIWRFMTLLMDFQEAVIRQEFSEIKQFLKRLTEVT